MRAGAVGQARKEQRCQQERRQVIDGPGQLDAVRTQLPAGVYGPGVVDKHMDARISRLRIFRQLPDTGLRCKVGG
jgi:hypothetical protein